MNLMYKALIIDDSMPVSFFNKVILERSKLFSTVEVAKNGQDAIELLDTGFFPDIIFLDLNMPVMNGWEFLKVYTTSKNALSPVVLLLGISLSDIDEKRLEMYPIVQAVKAKMLSKEGLFEIQNNILEA